MSYLSLCHSVPGSSCFVLGTLNLDFYCRGSSKPKVLRTDDRARLMRKLSIRDLDLPGQRVFIRVDFNVPLKHGQVAADTRIRAQAPTLLHAKQQESRVLLAS